MSSAFLRRLAPGFSPGAADRLVPAGGLHGRGGRCWLVVPAALLAVLAAGCGHAPPPKTSKTIEVIVTTPITADVRDYEDFTGRLDSSSTVDIRARADGYIRKADFKEGDRVREGDVLFEIDSQLYDADLSQAEANLQLAIADRNLQIANASRARQMINSRAIGKEEFDQVMAAREKAAASVQSMEAALKRARVNLGYTKVKCPLNGRISRRNVDPGNIAKKDDTLLATVVAEDPVHAYFDVDERTYLNLVAEKLAASPGARVADLKFPILMRLANQDTFRETDVGYVDFVDNRLNGNTGTIRMRGVFSNPQGILKSGLFIRIRLPIGQSYSSLLILDEALQSDQGRKFLYIVQDVKGSESKTGRVAYRRVSLGQSIGKLRVIKDAQFQLTDESLTALRADGVADGVVAKLEKMKDKLKAGDAVAQSAFVKELAAVLPQEDLQRYKTAILKRAIAEGLMPDERVVVNGMQRVRPKDQVQVKEEPPPQKPDIPLGKVVAPNEAKTPEVLPQGSKATGRKGNKGKK